MQRQLSPRDMDVLHALAMGTMPDVRSYHRLRLEMLGLVRDGANGLQLTAAGRQAITKLVTTDTENRSAVEERERDALGRRKGNTRKWVLS